MNLNQNIKNLNAFLANANRLYFIFSISGLLYLTFLLTNLLSYNLEKYCLIKDIVLIQSPNINNYNNVVLFSIAIIVAPLIETLLFQSLPYFLLKDIPLLERKKIILILISALFFGITHFYSLFYVMYAFLLGIILMYGYVIRFKNDNKTFFLICVSHAFLNSGIFVFQILQKG